uniref:DUF2254 domain-containing protein n=1 Tax=Haemonchus contortus TaxID=6289 RepID=A0A7I5ECT3_HAECO
FQMLTASLTLRLIMYMIGNVLTVASLYILFNQSGLHRNFRMVLFILIIFGFLRSTFTYCITFVGYIVPPAQEEILRTYFVEAFVFVICGFALASLSLSVERWVAIYKPKIYERYSHKTALAMGTLAAEVIITGITGLLANVYNATQWPLILVTTIFGLVSLIIAIIVWSRAKHLLRNRNSSLGQRFQIAETNRTSPVYLSISLNESISITAMSIVGFLMLQRDNTDVIASDDVLVDLVDALGAWRIIFINLVLIYYSFMTRRSRKLIIAHMARDSNVSTADYFTGLRKMWN